MIKHFSILLLLASLLYSCGKENKENESYQSLSRSVDKNQFESAKFKVKVSPENLIGSWINKEDSTGFELSDGGIASSVDPSSGNYVSWELIENKIILNSVKEKEIYIIRELYQDEMIISPSNKPEIRKTYSKNH